MNNLQNSFKVICLENPTGAFETQAARQENLHLMAEQLYDLGYEVPRAHGIKPKHIDALLEMWTDDEIGVGTIKNRMSHLRWMLKKVGKGDMMKKTNEEYGIGSRPMYTGNKAQKLDLEKLEEIECPYLRMSLRLQAAFGLRREEAIKFQPRLADKGDYIALKASWTKGGRSRDVPIVNDRQRALLDEAKDLAQGGALIPPAKNYIQQRRVYDNRILRAGFQNLHGLRHAYGQWRYKALTGMKPPAEGGPTYAEMTHAQEAAARAARLEISQELGHNREDVTNTYLGYFTKGGEGAS